jgi:phosphoribosylaminoimidazole-succinocarboxamide synthase
MSNDAVISASAATGSDEPALPFPLLIEGKTKRVYKFVGPDGKPIVEDKNLVIVQTKDTLTAGDGAKKTVIPGLGCLKTTTTVALFRCLQRDNVPTHFVDKDVVLKPEHLGILLGKREVNIPGASPSLNVDVSVRGIAARGDVYLMNLAEMEKYELVMRALAFGSYLRRNPDVEEGCGLNPYPYEIYIKDDARHDPMLKFDIVGNHALLYDPQKPMNAEGAFLGYHPMGHPEHFVEFVSKSRDITFSAFRSLQRLFASQGMCLIDFKIECGRAEIRTPQLAGVLKPIDWLAIGDCVDLDSMRLIYENGARFDKDLFRNWPGDPDDPELHRQILEVYGYGASLAQGLNPFGYKA